MAAARHHIVVQTHQYTNELLASLMQRKCVTLSPLKKGNLKTKAKAVKEVAEYYGVGERTLWRWIGQDSLETKPRSGRKKVVTPALKRLIVDTANERNGQSAAMTTEQVKVKLSKRPRLAAEYKTTYKGKTRKNPCKTTVKEVLREGKKRKVAVRPELTSENKKVRLNFAKQQLRLSDSDRNDHVAALDECYVCITKRGSGELTIHPNGSPLTQKQLRRSVKSKRHGVKILVLAAVARPRLLNPETAGKNGERAKFCEVQNGKVALIRCVEEVAYKKKVTKMNDKGEKVIIHEKGDKRVVSVTIDSERYFHFMTMEDGVLDKIQDYFGPDVEVRLQEDGAPGHGYNNKANRAPNATHDKLAEVAKSAGITIFKQPHNSPELNPLDLGIWHSLQSKVKRMDLPASKGYDDTYIESCMWEAVKKAWAELEPRTIWNCWMEKDEILKMLEANKGDSISKEPHTGIRTRWGTHETWNSI